jgi:diguanylate cyclase (GGDEF)-like protein
MTEGMTYAEIGQLITGITGILLLGLTGYGVANLRYRVPGTSFFVALALAGAVWSFGYAFEKGQILAEGFLMAARVEYLGLAFVPTLWLLVALSWMEHPLARSAAFRTVVLGISLVVVGLVATNDLHHWWYQSVVPLGRPGFARFQPAPAYYVFYTFLLGTFVFSTILLIVRRTLVTHFRRKAAVIVVSNLFPVAFSVAFQLGLRPGGLDLTVLSLIPAFSTVAWGLFRHEFIRIVPIARATVVESMEEAVLVLDDRGQLVDHNAAARNLLPQMEKAQWSDPGPQGELTLQLEGHARTFRFRRSPIAGPNGVEQGTVVVLSDITEEKRLLNELSHQASHDALTGVANRRHFEDHALGELTRAGRHGGALALVLFDLDWFKSINDRFGHPSGDKVLKAVVDIVLPRLRPYDLLARIGGEEFAVLMPEAQPVEAREAAERWRAALEAAPHILPGAVLPVTASFGVAALNDLPLGMPSDPRLKLDTLMGLADKALYRAKAEGRNRVV